MKKLTVSLEIAKRLKAAGWNKNTIFAYCDQPDCPEIELMGTDRYCESCSLAVLGLNAPTASEIAEVLPDGTLDVMRFGEGWIASYAELPGAPDTAVDADTMANALALLWLKLQEEK